MTKITLLTALLLLSCACSPYKVQPRNEPNVEIPKSFGVTTPGVKVPEHWWLAFQDKGLNEVVLQAFQDNLDLKQAWARLDQARALVTIESAARYPEVNLDASANRSKQVITDGNSLYSNRFKLGLGLTWEIDLWKKIANRAEAAVLLASASRADAEQTALLLSGTVVDLWFTIQEQEQLLEVLKKQIDASRTQLELTELRYGSGVGNALEVLQQRLQLAQVEAEIPTVRAILLTSRNQLAVVLGRPPQNELEIQPDPLLPKLPEFPELPTPRVLLDIRPDLRAAHDRVAAADREVAAAIADMLPTVRISLEGAFSSPSISSLFDNTAGSIAGGLLQPVFDADRRGAEADRRKAILRERAEAFSEQFLVALREIDDAIDREKNQVELIEKLDAQITIATSTLTEARIRFANGQTEYLDIITAIQALQQVQRRNVIARKNLLSYRAALYLALGGNWTRQLKPPSNDETSNQHASSTPVRDPKS